MRETTGTVRNLNVHADSLCVTHGQGDVSVLVGEIGIVYGSTVEVINRKYQARETVSKMQDT